MKNILFTLSLAAMILASCSHEDEVTPSKFITVNAQVGTLTKASSTAFEANDQISVYAWTGDNTTISTPLVVNNVINTYDGTDAWTPASQMLWQDMTTNHYFLGVYPAHEITDFTADPYTFDASNPETSDLLIATNLDGLNANQKQTVPLLFDHVMSKVTINLNYNNQWGDEGPTVSSVHMPVLTSATVDYLNKTVTATGTTTSDIALDTITVNKSYTSILVPQTIYNIVIKIDGKDYKYNNATGIILEKETNQVINLIVGRDEIKLGSVTINDWVAGTPIDGGEAQSEL